MQLCKLESSKTCSYLKWSNQYLVFPENTNKSWWCMKYAIHSYLYTHISTYLLFVFSVFIERHHKIHKECLGKQQLIQQQKYMTSMSMTKLCSLLITHHGEFSQGYKKSFVINNKGGIRNIFQNKMKHLCLMLVLFRKRGELPYTETQSMICNLMLIFRLFTPRCSLHRQPVRHLDLQKPINLCQGGEHKDSARARGGHAHSHTSIQKVCLIWYWVSCGGNEANVSQCLNVGIKVF